MSVVTCVVCGASAETGQPMAHVDCIHGPWGRGVPSATDGICDQCRGRRRIARMIEVVQRDMKVQQYEWDDSPVPLQGKPWTKMANG